jgi:hypothetical protein
MGWFSCKPTPQKYVEAAVTVASNLYLQTIPGAKDAPAPLEFRLQDSRYRYLIFCVSTVVTAVLAYDEKKRIQPEALIDGCLHFVSWAAKESPGDYFDNPAASQHFADSAPAYFQSFLKQWSQWPALEKEGRDNEIIDLISLMIRSTESNRPAAEADMRRLGELALQVDCRLPTMRGAFSELVAK